MVRLIFSIVFLVILAVFIAFNAQYTTDVNLFGYKLESIPVVAVVLLTLVTGVLYSFGLYLITFFSKRRSVKEKERKRKNEEKEKALKTQEKELKTAQESLNNSAKNAFPDPESGDAGVRTKPEKKPGIFNPLTRKNRPSGGKR